MKSETDALKLEIEALNQPKPWPEWIKRNDEASNEAESIIARSSRIDSKFSKSKENNSPKLK